MKRISLILAAVALALPSLAAAQTAPSCGLLAGAASDYTVVSSTATITVVSSTKYGTSANGYTCFRFTNDFYRVVNGKLVPQFTTASTSPVTVPSQPTLDAATAYRNGWNDALSAAAALKR